MLRIFGQHPMVEKSHATDIIIYIGMFNGIKYRITSSLKLFSSLSELLDLTNEYIACIIYITNI